MKLDNFEGTGLSWSVWSNYRFTDGQVAGLSVGGGIIYTDEWDGFGGRTFGDYYLVDLRASYDVRISDNIDGTFSVNIKNVTDEEDKGGGGWLEPRAIYLSAAFEF